MIKIMGRGYPWPPSHVRQIPQMNLSALLTGDQTVRALRTSYRLGSDTCISADGLVGSIIAYV